MARNYMLVALWRMLMRHARRVRRMKDGAERGFEYLGTEGVEEWMRKGGQQRTALTENRHFLHLHNQLEIDYFRGHVAAGPKLNPVSR
jgi:hypothetical protein